MVTPESRPGAAAATTTEAAADMFVGTQINFFCADVQRCAGFFERLGMPRKFVYPNADAPVKIEVEAGGVRIGFDKAEVANDIADLGVEAGGARSAEVAVWVTDVDAVYESALHAGGQALRAPMDSPDGRLRYGWVLDPEGHQIKILQKR